MIQTLTTMMELKEDIVDPYEASMMKSVNIVRQSHEVSIGDTLNARLSDVVLFI